ncbi:MAG: hypothetical protein J5835_05815 [Bacteroidales bacterium]|nr:hypothetical protein [Bacteroidales bacterium]
MKRILLHIAFFLLAAQAAQGQAVSWQDSLLTRFNAYATWCSPEKVYLHFDRSCYTAGETIWFRGWVKESSLVSALPPSNFLYAEVLDEHGGAVTRVKVKRSGSGFPGYIELPEDLETGNYTLRAYTLWQLNGSDEYMFNDSIRIIGGYGKKEKKSRDRRADVNLSFWPEGGRYFSGHNAVIGFKAVDQHGRSLDFSGTLVSDKDGALRQVFSTHDGMGVFAFVPEAGHRYSILDASGKSHPLPAPASEGATIQLARHAGKFYISALGFGGGDASLLVRDVSELYPLAQVHLDGKVSTLKMNPDFFRPDINHLLLVNSKGKILAERLFFIRDAATPECGLLMQEFSAYRRAPVRGEISLNAPDGTPLDGNCSVSVVRGALKGWQQTDGITSFMGLSSELKGRINQPYYYFNPDIPETERNTALDLLMLIHGWRYYELEKITDLKGGPFKIKHLREQVQTIRGHISRILSKKMPRKFTFTFMIPRQNVLQSLAVEKGRDFVIDSLDFQENTELLINIGTSRLGARYLPTWDGDPVAGPYRYQSAPGFASDVQTAVPQLEGESDYTLDAAVVTASSQDEDVLVFGRSFREDLVTYRELTLVEYLSMKRAVFEYDGENMYNRMRRRGSGSDDDGGGFDSNGNDSGIVKLIVGDSDEAWWSYDMLRLGDLRSLTISTQPDPIYGGDGGAVHITIKPGGMRRSAERNPSLLYFVPLGHQIPRYFESPRYDRGDIGNTDHRNTLFWAPDVTISHGRAIIEFCNSDLQDFPYIIRVEGLSADGRPFSRHTVLSP